MEISFIIIAVLALLVFGVYPIHKIENKQRKELNNNIEFINQKIEKLTTVEECDLLQKQINEYYRNTDSMLKSIRFKYQSIYNFIEGIKYIINKQNKNIQL